MLRVGLTGNIGSGKSTVARIWADLGACIIDADIIAREVLTPGSITHEKVVYVFGEEIFDESGMLDRKRLADIVFNDPQKLATLNELVHPPVIKRIQDIMEKYSSESGLICVVEAALILECGREADYDLIVVVDADPRECVKRVMEERDLTREEVERVFGSQMSASEKKVKADFIIHNNGSLEELRLEAISVYESMKKLEEKSRT
ncbi:MAG: dephospho-CoA kinase [Candidatus Glassbacteria bacterium]